MRNAGQGSPLAWAVALLSAGVTAAQLALMQVLANLQWHHFAHLVVAVALLGFGASGTLLTLARTTLLARAGRLLPWLMVGCSAGFAAVVPLLHLGPLRFDLYLLFVEPGQWPRLAVTCVLLAAPFFCAGLATALALTADIRAAGQIYFASLAGAGCGGLAGLGLLECFAPWVTPALCGLAPAAAAAVLFVARRDRRGLLATFAVAVALALLARGTAAPPLSPFKDLARALDLPEARVVHAEPGAQGWLQIVDAPSLRGAPPADLAFTGQTPRQLAVFIDGNRHGSILHDARPGVLDVFAAGAESLPWRLGTPRRVLLVSEGSGGEADFARQSGAETVVLAQPHRRLARYLREHRAADDWLVISTDEPRRLLARVDASHDLIRLPTVGALGGTAGLRAVGEDVLLTREGIAAAWRALSDDGTLLVTAWMDHPERTPLRLLATLVAGLREAGVETPPRHLAAVRSWASVTVLARRRALDERDVAAIRAFCGEHGFDPLLLPGLAAGERERNHAWDNADFFHDVDAIVAGDTPALSRGARAFRLDAPTDERPYFSQFLRPAALGELQRTGGPDALPYFELGSIIVAATLLVLTTLAVALVALPLVRLPLSGPGLRWTLVYFAALGAGFMLLEIVLMLRLTLFAGGTIPAAAIVLTVLLVAAGAGSAWSQRLAPTRRNLARICAGAAGGAVALAFATRLLPPGWDASWPQRAATAAVVIAPAAFVLGLAFPAGLRHLAARAPAQVPWAWAINSCVSVATPSAATLLAVGQGYAMVSALAAAAYAVACLATLFLSSASTSVGR